MSKCIIVSDVNVASPYQDRLCERMASFGCEVLRIVLPAGETSKSDECLQQIYDQALSWQIDRNTPLIAVGGGVVGDIAGFAAATLLRGIPLVHVPTSLLAQVDSAIGGKTGLNHTQGKNLIGSFYQPALVCADPLALMSLPYREWTSGLAEVFKHALIADEPFFSWIEQNLESIVSRDPEIVSPIVQRAAAIKCAVVSKDERESGLRMILNFGHTFGHALERSLGYGALTHGEAVIIGMRAALVLSRLSGTNVELERADRVLSSLPVPKLNTSVNSEALTRAMATDKKRTSERLRFVLLRKIGDAFTTSDVTDSNVHRAWRTVLPD